MSVEQLTLLQHSFSRLDVSIQAQVCQITLTRPNSLNAFDAQMRAELVEALTLASNEELIKVVTLLAEGGCFSAGADLSELAEQCDNLEVQLREEYAPIFSLIRDSNKLFIAGVQGVAAGIGAALAMSCDLVVMADDSEFYPAFMLLGLIPDGGSSWHFVRQLGYHKALEICLEAQRLDAPTCVALGLANKVVTADELSSYVNTWANQLTQGPALAQSHLKALLQKAQQSSFADAFALEATLQQQCFTSADFNEGLKAFFAKRAPIFSAQ